METADLIIRNARVLTSQSDNICDIVVGDGRVASLGQISSLGQQEIDATGLIATPGGVDVHAHIEQMSGMGLMNADTFETATRSAALGGTTSVISFAPQSAAPRLVDAVEDYAARARRGAYIDHAFHMILNDLTAPEFADDLVALIEAGHRRTTFNSLTVTFAKFSASQNLQVPWCAFTQRTTVS